ncbi:MAG: MarR family transcriptional regulator [Synergistaceae bacterium]|jgi:DNA-binding MarR family transcriptional regulator|nr:MarR family transcriptional regulator [Synergistaceae bacterium]
MNDRNSELMHSIVKLSRLLASHHFHSFRHFGPFANPTRGQGRVLSILKLQPEISQKELGYLLDMRNQSLGELLAKLERSGYITRTASEEDRRTANIKLTPEGLKAADESNSRESGVDLLLDCLSEEEKANLDDYLQRIISKLAQAMEDEGLEGGNPFYGLHGHHEHHGPHGHHGCEYEHHGPHGGPRGHGNRFCDRGDSEWAFGVYRAEHNWF